MIDVITFALLGAVVSMLALLVVPYIIYVSVKLGTYAFYRGRQLFNEENKNGEK